MSETPTPTDPDEKIIYRNETSNAITELDLFHHGKIYRDLNHLGKAVALRAIVSDKLIYGVYCRKQNYVLLVSAILQCLIERVHMVKYKKNIITFKIGYDSPNKNTINLEKRASVKINKNGDMDVPIYHLRARFNNLNDLAREVVAFTTMENKKQHIHCPETFSQNILNSVKAQLLNVQVKKDNIEQIHHTLRVDWGDNVIAKITVVPIDSE